MFSKFIYLPLFLFIIGCRETPTLPSWNTTINLPLTSYTFSIKDIISDTIPEISVDIDTIFVGESLYIDSFCQSAMVRISEIEINKTYQDSVFYSFGGLFPNFPHGDTMDLPSLSFNISDSLKLSEDFTSIGIDSGYITINFYNGLPLTIDSLYIILFIPESLGVFFTNVLPQQQTQSQINLSGKQIYNLISTKLIGWTQPKDSVIIDTSTYIKISIAAFINKLSSIIGKFPATSFSVPLDIPLRPFYINSLTIRSGELNFFINNPIKSNFDYKLEGASCSFLPITSVITYGNNDTTLDLANSRITPTPWDTLKLVNYFSTPGGYEVDTLTQADSLFIKMKISNITQNEFNGFIDSLIIIDLPEIGKKIDYRFDPNPNIYIRDVYLFYDIWNEVIATPRIKAFIKGIKEGNSRELRIDTFITYGENYGVISGDEVDSFFNFFPESLNITGATEFYGDIIIRYHNKIFGKIGLGIPLVIEIKDTIKIKPDTIISIDIPKEVREISIIDTPFLFIRIYNPTPISGYVYLYLSNNPDDFIAPIYLRVNEGTLEDTISLFEKKDLLKHKKIFSKVEFMIFPTQEEIKLRLTDKIIFKALLRIKIRTKKV